MDEIRALARDYAESAVYTLRDVMEDVDAAPAARVAAANSILARGFGMPERRVEQKVDVTLYDQRTAHLQALRSLAESAPAAVIIEDVDYSEVPQNPKKETPKNENAKQPRVQRHADEEGW